MASNKFATMLHKNHTPKIIILLIYTLLEWTLIALLLLNGLCSFLIAKLANFFGLKPPCLFCSRVDHLFGTPKHYSDLICDSHSKEISKLGYCSAHMNLAEASDMCEDCAPVGVLLPWMKRSTEEGDKGLRCSCCGVVLESGFYSPYFVIKPSSWGVLEYAQKRELEEEEGKEDGDVEERFAIENCDASAKMVEDDDSLQVIGMESCLLDREERLIPMELIDSSTLFDRVLSISENDEDDGRDYVGYNIVEKEDSDRDIQIISEEEEEEVMPLLATNEISNSESSSLVDVDEDEHSSSDHQCLGTKSVAILWEQGISPRSISVEELIASSVLIMNSLNSDVANPEDDEDDDREYVGYSVVEKDNTALDVETISEEGEEDEEMPLLAAIETCNSQNLPMVNVVKEEYSSSDHHCVSPESIATAAKQDDARIEALPEPEGYGEFKDSEEESKVVELEANCEISIGSEICDHEQIELSQLNEPTMPQTVIVDKEQVTETEPLKETIAKDYNGGLSVLPEFNEGEEDRLPETPTTTDSFHALQKRFLFERRESGTESLDGSVASETDGTEILTVDHLKTALKAERKAFSALYAELEEERSASAIAANQTMAMIMRLQEEKATMQMEALHYQRMMEEQSEYDQEALQLLNELMMKREKEKQELEKELEVYRKKVIVFESKERRKTSEKSETEGNGNGSGTSHASSSADDSDDLSLDSHEGKDSNYKYNEYNQNTPIDDVLSSVIADQDDVKHQLTLDDSLADFEAERLSILEQLKALEEKLFAMDDDNHDDWNIGHGEFSGDDINVSVVNGCEHGSDATTNRTSSGGKKLLPLLDSVDIESVHGRMIQTENDETTDGSPQSVSKPSIDDQKRQPFAAEVDNVYERLQALEADREFLEHCIRSLKKGDKGMDLLQEILQHLRDLRNVELRVRSASDALASLSA